MKPYRGTHGKSKPVERARASPSGDPLGSRNPPASAVGSVNDDEGILVPTDEHSESPKHYTILLHPQPDEMTFEQSVMHVRRTMYWDYLDGYWCDISLYPLGKWKLLEEQLKAAHEREMDALREENEKLRDLVLDYDKMLEIALKRVPDDTAPLDDAVHITLRSRMHKLGIEPEQ